MPFGKTFLDIILCYTTEKSEKDYETCVRMISFHSSNLNSTAGSEVVESAGFLGGP